MPMWPGVDTTARERVETAHLAEVGAPPQATADAPATWTVIGEHVDHIGGVVINALADLRVAVAVSFRTDQQVRVLLDSVTDTGGRTRTRDVIDMEEVATRAAAQQPGVDERGRQLTPPAPDGGLAARLGGILWTMIHRQLLSRDTPGCDVTVLSDVPECSGLGAWASMDAAFALALHSGSADCDDAPVRARLAEVCTQSAAMFSKFPPLRARHTSALRGTSATVSVIDYADGSLTQAPHLLSRDTRAFALFVPGVEQDEGGSEEIRARRNFVDRAAYSFGVDSLRLLPDASERVGEWLAAVHKVHGPAGVPALDRARVWLDFYAAETRRAQQLASVLRSRRHGDAWQLLRASQTALTHAYGLVRAEAPLVELCLTRGALSARSAAAGTSAAVIAVVPEVRAENFAADFDADGLMVIPLNAGEVAATGG